MKSEKSKGEQDFIDGLVDISMFAINLLDSENRQKEEKFLLSYCTEYYPLETGESIVGVTIEDAKSMIIEIKNQDGVITEKKESYHEISIKAEHQKETDEELIDQVKNRIERYVAKLKETLESKDSSIKTENTIDMIELMKKLTKANQIVEQVDDKLILSKNDRMAIESIIKDFETVVTKQDYHSIISQEKYQIPTLTELLDKIEMSKESSQDILYLEIALEYMKAISERTKSKQEYSTFRELPIEHKLTLSYCEYTLSKLAKCKLSLVNKEGRMKGQGKKYPTEWKQSQKEKIKEIRKKMENKEKLTRSEMLSYVFSLNGYQKEDIDEKVVRDNPSIVTYLSYLKEQFPSETIIDQKITCQEWYYNFAQKVQENREDAITYLRDFVYHKLTEYEEYARSYMEDPNDFTDINYVAVVQFLNVGITYLEATKQKSASPKQEEDRIAIDILAPKRKIDKLDKALEISKNLEKGIVDMNNQGVMDIRDLIDNYIAGNEMLNDSQDITETTSRVLGHIRKQCQVLDSWCPEGMQDVKEDKVPIPEELLLQKGLTV